MSDETKTTTETNKQVLWANVPWGVTDEEAGLQVTGNVSDRYLVLALSKQLQTVEAENVELKKQLAELKKQSEVQLVDTSTSDI